MGIGFKGYHCFACGRQDFKGEDAFLRHTRKCCAEYDKKRRARVSEKGWATIWDAKIVIEQLQAERDRYKEALEEISQGHSPMNHNIITQHAWNYTRDDMKWIAKQALAVDTLNATQSVKNGE